MWRGLYENIVMEGTMWRNAWLIGCLVSLLIDWLMGWLVGLWVKFLVGWLVSCNVCLSI